MGLLVTDGSNDGKVDGESLVALAIFDEAAIKIPRILIIFSVADFRCLTFTQFMILLYGLLV